MENLKLDTWRTGSVGSYTIQMSLDAFSSSHSPQCSCKKIPKSIKKQCYPECYSKDFKTCPTAHKWIHFTKLPNNREVIYEELKSITIESEKYKKYVEQIEIDLTRTFPGIDYFTIGPGVNALRSVLHAFVKYQYQLGYVQGMNYLVCVLLWHSSEVDAFWLLVVLMDEYKLRDNYLFRFPGLTKHCEMSELLLSVYMPKLYSHFSKCDIMVQMFATDWYLTLFTCLVPIENSSQVIDGFLKGGWVFAYKLLIVILERLENKLIDLDDRIDILRMIKPLELVNNDSESFLNSLKKGKSQFSWDQLVKSAKKKSLDMRHITNFMENYHMEIFHEDV